MHKKTAIIGVGNKLMGDEGIGIHAIEQLREILSSPQKRGPSESSRDPRLRGDDTQVDILDGGTGGMMIFHLFEKYDHIILIDAADFGGDAGDVRLYVIASPPEADEAISLTRLPLGDCVANARNDLKLSPDSAQVSLHGTSLAGILELARRLDKKRPEITIIAVQPKNISPTFNLSNECAKGIPVVIKTIDNLLAH